MIDRFAPWHTQPIVVVDFETTGTDPDTCMPVQVAAVRFEAGEPVDNFSSLIDPGCEIPRGAAAIHGITNERVAGAPPPVDVVTDCEHWIGEDSILCAYNAPFDHTILLRFGVFVGDSPWLDPLVMVREFDRFEKGKGRHRLGPTCKRWGVDLNNAHDALGDATATGRLLWELRGKLGDITYSELIRRQRIHAAEQEQKFNEWLAKQPPKEMAAHG